MKRCYICSVPENRAVLYEGIDKILGVVNICRKCYQKHKIPLIEKKGITGFEEETWEGRVKRVRSEIRKEIGTKKESREEKELERIVHKNVLEQINFRKRNVRDVVYKFNWVIMRKRRRMKLSQKDLSNKIQEDLVVIENLEKGLLPENYRMLLRKIEAVLKINLLKDKRIKPEEVLLESKIPSGLLVEELKEKVLIEGGLGAGSFGKEKSKEDLEEGEKKKKKGITQEEIESLIWGK